MKKLAIGVLSTGALALAGGLVTSYYMGGKIQQTLQQTAQAWSTEDSFSVRLLNYDRGIVRSQATTLWSFAGEESPNDITVTHDIVHGPWPMGKAARVVSRFQLPPESESKLMQALQRQPPLEWTAVADWSGASTHSLHSPAFDSVFEDGSALTWGGLRGEWALTAQRNAVQGFLRMPTLAVKVEDGNLMEMQDTEITFDAHLAEHHTFWSGPVAMKVGTIAVRDPEADTQFKIEGLDISSSTTLQDTLVDMGLDMRVTQVAMPQYKLDKVDLSVQLNNVDASWLDEMMLWPQQHLEEDEQLPSMLRSLPVLLAGKPEIVIDRFGMVTPEGPAQMSAHIAYVGQQPEAFNPVTDLHARLRATLPKTIVTQLLDSKVRSDYLELLERLEQDFNDEELQAAVDDGVAKRLKGLLELGALQDNGEAFSAEVELDRGELKLNGQPSELRNLLQLGGAI